MAAQRGVYVVHYSEDNGRRLTVSVGGESVPMEEFVRTHSPLQVTGLTHLDSSVPAGELVALILAEDAPELPGT